ncbi:ABC transporter ATP-binding protein [Marinicella pacifica]|jgi:putative ABC transport system ATP-binding protein|uniref:ABC transporter ATP-binding protein n=1 Tax=Marinicella pacifica TaxID=1171543 RepID=A0A917CJL7_9GAMM|nr:ABC transporter ATP-binding protein [Marinicella pacifica]GGF87811.1 ABC transporter ATP-binding protein [Marinicella pacifica]
MIKLDNISKVYRTQGETIRALDGVNLSIAEGEFVAIMGRSGSGKSTMLNILGCMDKPTNGRYTLAGQDVSVLDDDALSKIRNEYIGFVFQGFHLLPRLSALDNVLVPLRFATPQQQRGGVERAKDLLHQVGLGERIHHMPNEMSGGQIQRVAIARSLINNPSVLLADEPTGNLDSAISEQIIELLKSLNAAGQTIVMVTHEPDIADNAGRTLEFLDGKIVS